jgi:hypothetical protein
LQSAMAFLSSSIVGAFEHSHYEPGTSVSPALTDLPQPAASAPESSRSSDGGHR